MQWLTPSWGYNAARLRRSVRIIGAGHFETAIEEGLKATQIQATYSLGYTNVAFGYMYSNHLSEAEALMRKAAEAKVDAIELSLVRYFLAFLKNDEASMEQETTQRKSKSQAQGWFEHQEALTSAYHGRLKAAARLSNSAVTLAQQAGLREHASQFAGARAVWCVLYGVGDEGRSSAAAAKPL